MREKLQKIREYFRRRRARRLNNRLQAMAREQNIGLAGLPIELAESIIQLAHTKTLLALRLTCKDFQKLVHKELQKRCRETVVPPQELYEAMIVTNVHMNRRSSRYRWTDNPVSQPLARAVAEGRVDAVRFCLEAGLSANLYDLSARPLLHIAAFYSQVATARLLLQHGADPFATARVSRSTALDFAVSPELSHEEFGPPFGWAMHDVRRDEMVRLLLSEGGRFSIEAGPGVLPYLCTMPDCRLLLRQAYNNGTYPMDEAIARHLLQCERWPEVVKWVVAALPEALNPVIVTRDGLSAIEQALFAHHNALAMEMIIHGFPLNMGPFGNEYPELTFPLSNLRHGGSVQTPTDQQVARALIARPELQAVGFGRWVLHTGSNRSYMVINEPMNFHLRSRNWRMVNYLLGL
ncbi:ankyrin repeat domain-containing protein [Aspergillus saccharolyticus JOP 1030-1]|uniref:F-box domain-containing protein n=1 Tax=Aspergillus saccharolyticus JOP 1030-1 TaxID=1450539 RepID=A0A318ZGA7_9EURO|nr:hypothetical protein BP01DRAFT_38555 [Aspergillus saccharolyticus JOP 1030-1]PYH45757.1 hypothetical protein BP01DRAFT_38555 [Aspergillus saccharolyticus JOP 1030-1]